MKEIPLTQGKVAIVDDADYPWLCQYKWWAVNRGYKYWVAEGRHEKRKTYMHRLIMNAKKKNDVDHINGDTLDNRRMNLRECNRSENNMNQHAIRKGTSTYKGVSLCNCKYKLRKPWIAAITLNTRSHHIGYFATEEEAARAYDAKAKEMFKQYARPNFV